jgi:TetR/AcrR family transcriptional regulator, transcriptional repressor for nem operon
MGSKGENTREKILQVTQRIMLEKGFAGTTLEEIITESAITKGGFFYHFESKDDLARHLMLKYQHDDEVFFNGLFKRAEELSEDPLHLMLIFLKLLSESMAQLPDVHPGCLIAVFTQSSQMMNQAVRDVTAECLLSWRQLFQHHFDRINQHYPCKEAVSSADLADMLSTMLEGGIIVSRALSAPTILSDQLMQFRSYVRLLYLV